MTNKLHEKIYGCLVGGLIGDAMGARSELMDYRDVAVEYGWLDTFEGAGTDDSVIKLILTQAILDNEGYVTADEWAEAFLQMGGQYYPLFYVPVKNMLHKVESGLCPPVMAGDGNLQSSSSAMAIAPLGVLNACDPRQAALEAYDVAGLIHSGETNFCRDGASATAAAIAEAMKPDATVDSVASAATAYLHRRSAAVMRDLIADALAKARENMDYVEFRDWFYNKRLQVIHCDSRETIPAALALFLLAEGDPEKTIVYSANFGRDSDTIGTIAGAVAGAYRGIRGFPDKWVRQVESYYNTVQDISSQDYGALTVRVPDYRELSRELQRVIRSRNTQRAACSAMLGDLTGGAV